MGKGWYNFVKEFMESEKGHLLKENIQKTQSEFNTLVYPNKKDIFAAFNACPLEKLQAVIVAYEPYKKNCANGFAMGFNGDGKIPSSAVMLYNKWENEVADGLDLMFDMSLRELSGKGILFLNLALTTASHETHIAKWKDFSLFLLRKLIKEKPEVIYVAFDKRVLGIEAIVKDRLMKIDDGMPFSRIQKELNISLN